MNSEDKVVYLGNVIFISAADGKLSDIEGKVIEGVRQNIGASETDLKNALSIVGHGKHRLTPIGRFSDKVRNLEDMVFTSLADGNLSEEEKPELLSFAKAIGINQDQLKNILSEAKVRVEAEIATEKCPDCKKDIPPESNFCPGCGASVESR